MINLASIVSTVAQASDELFTSDEERGKLKIEEKRLALEEKKIHANIVTQQTQINLQEAKHKSIFVAGWRPFIGWTCGAALAMQYIIRPIGNMIIIMFSKETAVEEVLLIPSFDTSTLLPLVMGMLGMGALRTYDKMKGIDTRGVK